MISRTQPKFFFKILFLEIGEDRDREIREKREVPIICQSYMRRSSMKGMIMMSTASW